VRELIQVLSAVKSTAKATRLVEVDALRGLAAMAVVLFHFTRRFAELYPGHGEPLLRFNTGHYGVNLFFIISGFVIFMTLERTQRPMDFVVSRFSRLFPSYWLAIALTFGVTHLLGLPGKLVDASTALANVIMVHGLFWVPHVDGVYWTLEVEMLFYCGMFLLYRLQRLGSVHMALAGLLLLRVVYWVLEHHFGINLPWMIYRLLILQYIPWFALGISVYLLTRQKSGEMDCRAALATTPPASSLRGRRPWQSIPPAYVTAILALVALVICDGVGLAALALIFATAVFLAASGHFALLRLKPCVWLGTISYPLYLVHENIGWAVMLQLSAVGLNINLVIGVALVLVLILASAVTRWVEQPAMQWIRSRYKQRLAQRAP